MPPLTATKPARGAALIRGVYAVTPDDDDTARLADRVESCLAAGVRLLQYRHKSADAGLRRRQLEALVPRCERHGCLLVVNDDWALASAMGLGAVHLGADDGDAARVRAALGPDALIGVSCYASLERARDNAPCADYLAFGSVFASPTKPQAPGAALAVLGAARALGRPVVAIGGITATNAADAIRAGADAVAVISALFSAPDPGAAARLLIGRCEAALQAAAR